MDAKTLRGRSLRLWILVSLAGVLALASAAQATEGSNRQQEEHRRRLVEHPLFDLKPGSSHADSLAAIQFDRFVIHSHDPACLALTRIVDIAPPDSAALLALEGIPEDIRPLILSQVSTITYEVLEVLGRRSLPPPQPRQSTPTLSATSLNAFFLEGRPVQLLLPGSCAYIILKKSTGLGGLELLVTVLCLGEPNEDYLAGLSDPALEGPLFGLRDKVAPLFAEFGRALSASDPDAAAAQGESSIPSGQ
jgi:hypothetical protein